MFPLDTRHGSSDVFLFWRERDMFAHQEGINLFSLIVIVMSDEVVVSHVKLEDECWVFFGNVRESTFHAYHKMSLLIKKKLSSGAKF